MSDRNVRILWFRRDLRLSDHPALAAAARGGAQVIPLFILDPQTEAIGAAPLWRLGLSIAALARSLERLGSRLILRRGSAIEVLGAVARETGAGEVHWTRLTTPESLERDGAVEIALTGGGILAVSHGGHLLHEPEQVQTKAGGFFKVYTPFWRAVAAREVAEAVATPERLPAPPRWPASDRLEGWHLGRRMSRGAGVVAAHLAVGEEAARARLRAFLEGPIETYAQDRDRPDRPGTSRLSAHLATGEISPGTVWRAALAAEVFGAAGAETFRKELIWREFAWHLLFHTPWIISSSWRPDWDAFPWREDNRDAERWRRGLTGEPMVDAGLREMSVTGTMHNRVRMLVASYLTKHLLTHWKVGLAWFADCLVDWDPASNAMGWQWVAGSGPDAAPFFRVFNPSTQAEKFDPEGRYRRRFVAGLDEGLPMDEARDFFRTTPRSWGLDPAAPYPRPIVEPRRGREVALAAYRRHRAALTSGRS